MTALKIAFAILIGFTAVATGYDWYESGKDQTKWDLYVAGHACRITTVRHISSYKDITTWLCDDGVQYTR